MRCVLATAVLLAPLIAAQASSVRGFCHHNIVNLGGAIQHYELLTRQTLSDICDRQGRPLLSWRVRLLPYIESDELYGRFHLDEPWDSPHNRQFIAKVPECYRCWGLSAKGVTTYLAVRRAFAEGSESQAVAVVPMTTVPSTAAVVVEADEAGAVIWTKPEDWSYDPANPCKGIGRSHGSDPYRNLTGFVLFADGSVRFVPTESDPDLFRAIFEANAGPARLELPWFEALLRPRVGSVIGVWLLLTLLAVGGALRVGARLLRLQPVSPGEHLWLIAGFAFGAHAIAVFLSYRYYQLPRLYGDGGPQTLFWFPPAVVAMIATLIPVVWFRCSTCWRVFFRAVLLCSAIVALDAAAPYQYRRLEESFVTASSPVFWGLVGIAAGLLTCVSAAKGHCVERRLAHWAGIVVCVLPLIWFDICLANDLVRLRGFFERIID